jgi:uncharacterized protein involved in outer membrane biogenesis
MKERLTTWTTATRNRVSGWSRRAGARTAEIWDRAPLPDRLKAFFTRTESQGTPTRWRFENRSSRRMATGVAIGAGVFGALILFLGVADWNWFKGPVESYLSARAGRTVAIDGDLDVSLISWTPGARLEGLRVANTEWAGGGDMASIERLEVKVRLLPLLRGDVVLPLLAVEKPQVRLVRNADGDNNWTFGRGGDEPFSLPPIRRFEINEGDLQIEDAIRRLTFAGTFNSSEIVDQTRHDAFRLEGDGALNGEAFLLNVTGGPLLNVDPNEPYPFDAEVRAGATTALANGSIAKPFDLAVFDADLTLTGDDLADVFYLTGLALPNTPPYEVSGHLSRRTDEYRYDGIDGVFGDTDMHGVVRVRTGGPRLYLNGDLRSDQLDFDDLAAVLGAGADTRSGADASPEQAQTARELAATGRLFPDTPLRVERLRLMDGDLTYVADSILSENFPLTAGSVEAKLENGLLRLDPLVFDLATGRLAGATAINARNDVPWVDLDMRLSGARIDQFIPARFGGAVSGPLVGRAKLSGPGRSVREVAAGADGQVTLVVAEGQMREPLAEMLGVNILRGLFADPDETVTLRCAVADFKVTDGIMNAQTLVLDTDPVIATGGGVVNLRTERMALEFKGHPKEARFVRLSVPLELNGPMRRPSLDANPETAIAQGAGAAFLAAVLSPLAAILPFVDPGLAEDANCQSLIDRAGTGSPAPVVAGADTEQTAQTPQAQDTAASAPAPERSNAQQGNDRRVVPAPVARNKALGFLRRRQQREAAEAADAAGD